MRQWGKLLFVVAALAAAVGAAPTPSSGASAPAGPVVADGPGGDGEFVVHPDPLAEWPDAALTYGFDNFTADLTQNAQRGAIRRALDEWASVTPLTFTEVPDCGLPLNDPACTEPDIRFGFFTGDHGPDEWDPLFDGVGGSLAHAFYGLPSTGTLAGDVHFDDAENWTTSLTSGRDLESVALHEIGHVLGIKHSAHAQCLSINQSLLRPTMCQNMVLDRGLAPDDVQGVRSLYGRFGPTCAGFPVTARWSLGQRPTQGDDVVLGSGAANIVNGLGGRDVLCGGIGADTLNGGVGNDRLYGGRGQDVCDGQGGADVAAASCEVVRGTP